MKLISWNLNGLEDKDLDVRTEAAMFQVLLGAPIEAVMVDGFKPNVPDVVVLQEVVERTYFAHIVPHLKAAGFSIFPPEPTERSYFEVVAVRNDKIEANYTSFKYSDQGRGLTTLTIDGLTIMTAHLESMKPGAQLRIEQARVVLEEMNRLGPCIFAGDTNLREAEWENLEKGDIQDAWVAVGSPKNHRMTWHYEKSKSRFDRAWVNQLNIQRFETFGKKNIATINSPPSDHLGLRIEFELLS